MRSVAIFGVVSIVAGWCIWSYAFDKYKKSHMFHSRTHHASVKHIIEWKKKTLIPSKENITSFNFNLNDQDRFNFGYAGIGIHWDSGNMGGLIGTTMREDLIKQVESDAFAMIKFIELLAEVEMKDRLKGIIDTEVLSHTHTKNLVRELESYLPYVSPIIAEIIRSPFESISAFHTQAKVGYVDVSKFLLYQKGKPRTFYRNYHDTIRYYYAYREYWITYLIKNTYKVDSLHVPRHRFRYVGKNWYKY